MKPILLIACMMISAVATVATVAGCSTAKSILAIENKDTGSKPISNPFGDYYLHAKNEPQPNIILRTKKGDRSVEVELPGAGNENTDFTIPVSPHFKEDRGRSPASEGSGSSGALDEAYKDQIPTPTDREITANMPAGTKEDESRRREIETGLGLVPSDDNAPERDKSYLGAVDHVKQLFKFGRYEASLIELDGLLRLYQTDARLYEMRGTLLDRLGKTDLAIKSWTQALRFDPNNQGLRKFVERRQQKRSVASP